MNKALHLYAGRGYLLYLFKGKLSCGDNSFCAKALKVFRGISPGDRHLRAYVGNETWKVSSHKRKNAQVLNEHRIDPVFIKRQNVVIQLFFYLPFFKKSIYGKIDLFIPYMRKIKRRKVFINGWVVRVCPGRKSGTAHIYRIGAGIDRGFKR